MNNRMRWFLLLLILGISILVPAILLTLWSEQSPLSIARTTQYVSPTTELTPSSTATIAPDPTRLVATMPIVKPTTMPIFTPTLKPVPVWQIFFDGAPCAELNGDCTAYPGMPTYHYSLNSDGTELKQIETISGSEVLALPPIPRGAPVPYGRPQLSPNHSSLVYYTNDVPRGLYLVDVASEKTSLLLSSKAILGSPGFFYPVCWSPDGSEVRFSVRFQEGQQRRDAFYSIDTNGQSLKILFTLMGVGSPSLDWAMHDGTCSPDGQEVAFSIYPDPKGGLYVLNLDSGQWRQVLAGYGVYRLMTKNSAANSKP
jgi:hypothetical protein